ncbi:MAG: FG-GAP-like repeat-containing protein [Planctomycetota bacterium]|jgi:hypothetical protein
MKLFLSRTVPVLLAAAAVLGQVRAEGEADLTREFGSAVSGIGDVNGDRVPDLVVSAPGASPEGKEDAGEVLVISGGKDAAVLLRVSGPEKGWRIGRSVSGLGDVNGDGVPDFAVGTPNACPEKKRTGLVVVHSGKDGAEIWKAAGEEEQHGLGWSVAGAGDLDGDGVEDLLVGVPGNGMDVKIKGHARLLSGKDGSEICRFRGKQKGERFGICVARVGDLNGDGVRELCVGAPFRNREAGALVVYSGKTQKKLFEVSGKVRKANLGQSVADAGDLDGDRRPDLAIGAPGPGADEDDELPGEVIAVSSRTRREIRRFKGLRPGDWFGSAVVGLRDQNGDKVPDFAVGAPYSGGTLSWNGSVLIVSGKNGEFLSMHNQKGERRRGWAISPVGDLNGDGIPDFAVGNPAKSPFGKKVAGDVELFSGKDADMFLIIRR